MGWKGGLAQQGCQKEREKSVFWLFFVTKDWFTAAAHNRLSVWLFQSFFFFYNYRLRTKLHDNFSDNAPHLLQNCIRSRNENWTEVRKTFKLSLLTAGFPSWTPTPGTWGRVLVLPGPSGPPPERNPTSSLAADWAPYWEGKWEPMGRSSEKSTALSCCAESTTEDVGRSLIFSAVIEASHMNTEEGIKRETPETPEGRLWRGADVCSAARPNNVHPKCNHFTLQQGANFILPFN